MARVRSPNYPAFGLSEAIKRIGAIHAREQHLAAPKEVIAKHLGYNGINGGSLKAISALSKFGLLDEISGDKFKLSPLAIRIMFPKTDAEHAQALNEAAYKPALFQEIHNEWEGHRPSDENLRTYLIRRNFASDALDRVIEAYRETMDLVTQKSGSYVPPELPQKHQANTGKPPMQPQTFQAPRVSQPISGQPMSVAFIGDRLQVSAVLEDAEAVDKLIKALTANKTLLPAKPPKKDEAA